MADELQEAHRWGGGLRGGAELSLEVQGLALESVYHQHPVHHLTLFCIPPARPGEGGAIFGAAELFVLHVPSEPQQSYFPPLAFLRVLGVQVTGWGQLSWCKSAQWLPHAGSPAVPHHTALT